MCERIWQREGAHYTVRTAANEFARTYWQEPREIVKWTPLPGNAAAFQVKDGVATYRVFCEGQLFVVEREAAATDETNAVMYVDGGCRGNGAADAEMYGSFLLKGKKRVRDSFNLGNGTNNRAEYLTLIRALECVKANRLEFPIVYMDSMLIVSQVNGEWRVKDNDLVPLRNEAKRLLDEVKGSLRWVSRSFIFEKLGH